VNMTNKICSNCGVEDADILCKRCGNFVCDECYDEESELCIECLEELEVKKEKNKIVLRVGGVVLILIGLSAMASGLMLGIPVEGVTIVFPFIMGTVSPLIAGGYSFIFFSVIGIASLLPWYIHTWEEEYDGYPESSTYDGLRIKEGKMQGGESVSSTDYVITTEVPKKLVKTIMVETRKNSISLTSSVDKEFAKTYSLPNGFNLEGIDYDYDEGYLILNLHLARVG
jgi:hypothetical protein